MKIRKNVVLTFNVFRRSLIRTSYSRLLIYKFVKKDY